MYFYYILKKVLINYIQYLPNIHQEIQNNFQGGTISNQDNEDEDNITNQEEPSILSTPTTTRYKTSRPKFAQFTPRSSSCVQEASKIFRVKLATTNPFATHSNAIELAWKSYAESFAKFSSDTKNDTLLTKMKKDSQFAKETTTVVCLVTSLYCLIINYFIDNSRKLSASWRAEK